MNRFTAFFAFLLVFSSSVCLGQFGSPSLAMGNNDSSKKFRFFVNLGLSISTLPGLTQHKSIYGLNFGFGASIKLNKTWALTPELILFSPRGANDVVSIYNDITIQNSRTALRTNYIDLPLLLQYEISENVSVAAGPQISFLVTAYQTTTGSLASGRNVVVTEDIKSLMHKESFMVPVQVAYALSSKRWKRVIMKARYNIGIMEVFTATSIASSTHSTFQFIVGFPFF